MYLQYKTSKISEKLGNLTTNNNDIAEIINDKIETIYIFIVSIIVNILKSRDILIQFCKCLFKLSLFYFFTRLIKEKHNYEKQFPYIYFI